MTQQRRFLPPHARLMALPFDKDEPRRYYLRFPSDGGRWPNLVIKDTDGITLSEERLMERDLDQIHEWAYDKAITIGLL